MGERCGGRRQIIRSRDDGRGPEFNNHPDSTAGTDISRCPGCPDCTPPMMAALQAMSRVRDGMWIKGAPTHVLAEFLNELEAAGWELRPASELTRLREGLERIAQIANVTFEHSGEMANAVDQIAEIAEGLTDAS